MVHQLPDWQEAAVDAGEHHIQHWRPPGVFPLQLLFSHYTNVCTLGNPSVKRWWTVCIKNGVLNSEYTGVLWTTWNWSPSRLWWWQTTSGEAPTTPTQHSQPNSIYCGVWDVQFFWTRSKPKVSVPSLSLWLTLTQSVRKLICNNSLPHMDISIPLHCICSMNHILLIIALINPFIRLDTHFLFLFYLIFFFTLFYFV